ncbi:MAG: PXA domain-containing protein [Podila humilis]|nr:MAG: PXA domain-containing protein [Podila humilis]
MSQGAVEEVHAPARPYSIEPKVTTTTPSQRPPSNVQHVQDHITTSDEAPPKTETATPTSSPVPALTSSPLPSSQPTEEHQDPSASEDTMNSDAKTTSDKVTSSPPSTSDTHTSLDIQSLFKQITNRDERELTILAVVGGLIVIRLLLPQLSVVHVLIGTLGMGVGGFGVAFYLLSVPEHTRVKRALAVAKLGTHGHEYLDSLLPDPVKSTEPKAESSHGIHLTETKDATFEQVQISSEIDPMVEDMIAYALRDFVNVPVGLVSEGHHNIPLRASMVAMAMNLANRLGNMRLPETALLAVFGIQNSFIVHLRAYRELRSSRLPIAEYVMNHANADSVLGRCYHKEERLKQFRSTARAMCQSLLSKNDQQSMALFAVMQEIMATHVLESTLEHMCDPDFINLAIIDYFNTPEPAKTDSETSKHTESKASEAPITSLADSILMNAANLMDKSGLENQGSSASLYKPLSRQPSTASISNITIATASPPITQDTTLISEKTPIPSGPIGLRQVLSNKSEHIDLFQEFMDYLQVWDAMDLAQFWLMIDIFHRQIEQGTLSEQDLQHEANNIYVSYCGPDVDHNVSGIRDAKNGALLKNLKKSIPQDPANSFKDAQDWALGVLDSQYWVPFEIKRVSRAPKEPSRAKSPLSESPINADATPTTPVPPQSPQPVPTQPEAPSSSQEQEPIAQARPAPPVVQSIHVSDMVHVRPKTLMSNSDLSYMVEVQTEGGQGWMVTRTFQQIEQLQQVLVQQFPVVQRTVFPRWRLQPSDKVCNGIQAFLRAMLAIPEVHESSKFAFFLSKEYDLNPDGTVYDHGLNRKNSMSFGGGNVFDQSKALGMASQGAKNALRQASEASFSAGRFFKSLGGNTNSSGQLADDKSMRGSFESTRSNNSTAASISEHGQGHAPSTPIQRFQDETMVVETHSRASSSSDSIRTKVGQSAISTPHVEHLGVMSSPQTPVLGHSPMLPGTTPRKDSQEHGSADQAVFAPQTLEIMQELEVKNFVAASEGINTPSTHLQPQPQQLQPPQPPASPAPSIATSTVPKPKKVSLLSNDELDLLIETSFTVLEDMMDFSKGQSIRRMTFGMLRELVRKSYRTAINQSFSDWVEMNTSQEKAVELVQWMKDDILWPGGQWPTSDPAAAGEATRTQQEKDATRDQARELVKMMLPGSLVTVLGREAVLRGLVDVFEMFQIKELNLGLALSVFEMTVRLVLTR